MRKSSRCSDMPRCGLTTEWPVGRASRSGGVRKQDGVQADSSGDGRCRLEGCVSG